MVEVIQQPKHLPQQLCVDNLNNKGKHLLYIIIYLSYSTLLLTSYVLLIPSSMIL